MSSDRLVELQEEFCWMVASMCAEATIHDASEIAQILHCSKPDAEAMRRWGRIFEFDAIEPAHFKIHPTMDVIKAILQAPDPHAAREWAMVNEAGSKAIKQEFGVAMTTPTKPTIVNATAELQSEGVYKVVVPLDVKLPRQVKVSFKEE